MWTWVIDLILALGTENSKSFLWNEHSQFSYYNLLLLDIISYSAPLEFMHIKDFIVSSKKELLYPCNFQANVWRRFLTYFMEKKAGISRIQFTKGYDLWAKAYSDYLLLTKLMLQLQVNFSLSFKSLHESDGNDLRLKVKPIQGRS